MKEIKDRLFQLADDFHKLGCTSNCDDCEVYTMVKIYTGLGSSHSTVRLPICSILQDIYNDKGRDKNVK